MSQKILVVGPAWVGDMVMAQSLFKAIKQQSPDSILHVLASDWCNALLARMPQVDCMHKMPVGHGKLGLKARKALAKELCSEQFDSAYVLPRSFKSALIPWMAKIPKRIGYRGEMRYGLLTKLHVLKDHKRFPNVCNYLRLLDIETDIDQVRNEYAPELQTEVGKQHALANRFSLDTTKPIFALMIGAEYGPSKQWPPEYYGQLASRLCDEGGQVVLLGSAKEKSLGEEVRIASENTGLNLCGETTLDEAIDILAMATVAVCNDSGLMHIAAAVDTPVVALYGGTTPNYTPPLSKNARALYLDLACSPCWKRECEYDHYRCMRDIRIERVLDATLKAAK